MKASHLLRVNRALRTLAIFGACCFSTILQGDIQEKLPMEQKLHLIQENKNNSSELSKLLPIVHSSFTPSPYERVLMTRLRDQNTSMQDFRQTASKLAGLLIGKVVAVLDLQPVAITTPLTDTEGLSIASNVNLVSIMRSGDALLETFGSYFPEATISKILIQRDEETAKPIFKYMKLSSSIGPDATVVITEPLIATGGTLSVAIDLLKQKGVAEENIIIASICTAPEGLLVLSEKFPKVKVVMVVMDDHLNERKYIVPGLGDFGDRFFGTVH